MNDLMSYEEPMITYMRRDSIMNFMTFCTVDYKDKKGIVVGVFGNKMKVQFSDGSEADIHYSQLHVTGVPFTEPEVNAGARWKPEDNAFILENPNMDNVTLAAIFQRSPQGISNHKNKLKRKKK